MAFGEGVRQSANIIDRRDDFAMLVMLVPPLLACAAAWVGFERWRHRIAAWLLIAAITAPAFLF